MCPMWFGRTAMRDKTDQTIVFVENYSRITAANEGRKVQRCSRIYRESDDIQITASDCLSIAHEASRPLVYPRKRTNSQARNNESRISDESKYYSPRHVEPHFAAPRAGELCSWS